MKAAVFVVLSALIVWSEPGAATRVDNFVLLDQNGASHELYYLSDKKAVVIMIQGNGCQITRNAWPTLTALRAKYGPQGVEFLLLNSNLQDDRESIRAEAAEFGYDIPILVDETQLVGESLKVVRTAEAFVIDPKGWQLVYRGPIDDRLTYERQKSEAKENWLADTLDAVLAGRPVEVAEREGVGCIVNFPAQAAAAPISYSETIAPLLIENCVACHREGGIAPWAMKSYRMILGFAPTIREVVRTRRMPPWHADPHVGSWVGDRSLAPEDAATLVHWIEAGAPRGDGPDPLESVLPPASEWPLGEPDLVITLPPFEVPATGVVAYQYPYVPNPLDHPVWVRAAAVAPGDRTVVHHVLTGYTAAAGNGRIGDVNIFESYLNGYAPGMEAVAYPEDTGVLVAPGGGFVFQMHYTPTGKAVTDVTRLGLYFYDKPPTRILRHTVAVNPQIRIEPYDPADEESAYIPFDKDAIIYSLFPHAHYRGRSSKFEIEYPDGRKALLLSVPKYDFNWQREYVFTQPLVVPAGSKIIHTTVYDNSPQNPGNPDPSRRVPWGQQSWDEMLYGSMRYRWRDETVDQPIHDAGLARVQQFFGYADRNRNDLVEFGELPLAMRILAGRRLQALDVDGDGALSIEEFGDLRAAIRD
jgi:AhpC/TSA family